MSKGAAVYGYSRRRWVVWYWCLNIMALLLIVAAFRFIMFDRYPLGPDQLYPLLYLQTMSLAILVVVLAGFVRKILKHPELNRP